jgi:hypothetical protein
MIPLVQSFGSTADQRAFDEDPSPSETHSHVAIAKLNIQTSRNKQKHMK